MFGPTVLRCDLLTADLDWQHALMPLAKLLLEIEHVFFVVGAHRLRIDVLAFRTVGELIAPRIVMLVIDVVTAYLQFQLSPGRCGSGSSRALRAHDCLFVEFHASLLFNDISTTVQLSG